MDTRPQTHQMSLAYVRPINLTTDVDAGGDTRCHSTGCRETAEYVALWRLAGLPKHQIHSRQLCPKHASAWRSRHKDIYVDDPQDLMV